jgi:hypothetical protein
VKKASNLADPFAQLPRFPEAISIQRAVCFARENRKTYWGSRLQQRRGRPNDLAAPRRLLRAPIRQAPSGAQGNMVAFFKVHCRELPLQPRLHGVCAGYESGKWRAEQLSRYLMEWLPEFSLSYSERQSINDTNSVAQLRKAAKVVYDTDKYDRRGEFGELILHALMRETIKTDTAISKIFFKDSVNNTVKGFDAVHVLPTPEGLELWLGEVKFYTDYMAAVNEVVAELQAHVDADYLKNEFVLITNKLDPKWPGTPALEDLLHRNRSLDEVVSAIVVPVLLTYDSSTTQSFTAASATYKAALEAELVANHARFLKKNKVTSIRIELFLFPMASKKELLDQLHRRLIAAQDI